MLFDARWRLLEVWGLMIIGADFEGAIDGVVDPLFHMITARLLAACSARVWMHRRDGVVDSAPSLAVHAMAGALALTAIALLALLPYCDLLRRLIVIFPVNPLNMLHLHVLLDVLNDLDRVLARLSVDLFNVLGPGVADPAVVPCRLLAPGEDHPWVLGVDLKDSF